MSKVAHSCLSTCCPFVQTNRFAIRKNGAGKRAADPAEQGTDYASKLLHLAWHPEANVIAAAASNSLYMYTT
jgi:serine/threonine-protein phosphatase 2A regulatory subunit B